MQIHVIKGKRRTALLQVDNDGAVVLKVPQKYPENKINEFIYSKRKWIENKVAMVLNFAEKAAKLNRFEVVLLFGEESPAEFLKGKNLNKQIRKWYEKIFEEEVLPMVKKIGEECSLKCKFVESVHSYKKWGSFDLSGTMKLNYKICMLPKNLVRYIIVHEFCHSLEMNHSPRFWANVFRFDPSFRQHRKQLKEYSYILGCFKNC